MTDVSGPKAAEWRAASSRKSGRGPGVARKNSSGSPNDVGATLLDIYVNEFHVPPRLFFEIDGAYNGQAAGVMNLHVTQQQLQDCANGPGLKSDDFDLENHTVNPLYG